MLFLFFFATKTYAFMRKEVITMTYKQIEASREVRLWIGQVIVPTIGVVAVAMSNPEVRRAVGKKADDVKQFVKTKFKKN